MTTALSKIHELYARVAAYEALFEESKKTLQAFYVSDAPLAERWEAFIKCPKSLREHKSWIIHLQGGTEHDLVGYGEEYHAERYSIVDVVDVVTMMTEYAEEGTALEGFYLAVLKEEILAAGVHSFTYDW